MKNMYISLFVSKYQTIELAISKLTIYKQLQRNRTGFIKKEKKKENFISN